MALPERLEPRLDLLREEYVLVQAWKKTASYIRYHNWYSDTLALDMAAVNLPEFIGKIRERLESTDDWKNRPLRLVPAPKKQRWAVQDNRWGPLEDLKYSKLRPLAHVDLSEQVIATAVMMCLADRVETIQGDPRYPVCDSTVRKKVISYGNRLFCDDVDGELRHRWGSSKLYRAYFGDFRTFITRSAIAADLDGRPNGRRRYIVHADLRQFYDRVRPGALGDAIERVREDRDDSAFFGLAKSVLDWTWHQGDRADVRAYAESTKVANFGRVALPQGLVASGFFANVALLSFDDGLRATIGNQIEPGVSVVDVCRYVDDLRVLVAVAPGLEASSPEVEEIVSRWLDVVLKEHCPGLILASNKTQVVALDGDGRRLARQAAKMARIQSAVSGGFDARGGEEILDAIQGLVRAQRALSEASKDDWRLRPIADVRDETVARFAAGRYRYTFRSTRPLLMDVPPEEPPEGCGGISTRLPKLMGRTQDELDEDVRAFALTLVESWINDPSNVRLLRIGLDLWPDVDLLHDVVARLLPFTETEAPAAPKHVAWYCLAEVLRAAATETGLVPDNESLPVGIDLQSYRDELLTLARRFAALPDRQVPWYLRQQALLFLAAYSPHSLPPVRGRMRSQETRHYGQLIRFLRGETRNLGSTEFATLAILSRRGFANATRALELTRAALNQARLMQIARMDLSFARELLGAGLDYHFAANVLNDIREELWLASATPDNPLDTLALEVLRTSPKGRLRNELSLLRFASCFIEQWQSLTVPRDIITPTQVSLTLRESSRGTLVESVSISDNPAGIPGLLYRSPSWCQPGERWRLQLGFLLRFILSAEPDFSCVVRPANWKEGTGVYRPTVSHWFQRMYGFYNEQSAFGDDWLPITEWLEGFLFALLRWPGCPAPGRFGWVEQGVEKAKARIRCRIQKLESHYGTATETLILPLRVRRSTGISENRPLRGCVVQTVVPDPSDVRCQDLGFDEPEIRRRHGNHLSAALAAVRSMLNLRMTHTGGDGELDWLILPELAVHPDHVRSHLIPFARAYKAIVLAGVTYQKVIPGEPYRNTALWVIPEWSQDRGFQVRIRRQGKAHLAAEEEKHNEAGVTLVQGFRPCQWLIGYPWSISEHDKPIWLTSAICYDATDLRLAADLRDRSDVLAIPALNKDVRTFDQMAQALHYHMFQLVIVANNGRFGGSNAYWPRSGGEHERQLFHLHGQPQASIAFFEIKHIKDFLGRKLEASASGKTKQNSDDWKHPPAGLG